MVKTKGGRIMNPTDAFRKQQRKKEVQRNKLERKLQREAYQKKDKPKDLAEELQTIIVEQEKKGVLSKSQRIKKKVLQDAFEASIKKKKEEQGKQYEPNVIPNIPASSKHQISGGAVIPKGLQGLEKANVNSNLAIMPDPQTQLQAELNVKHANTNPIALPVPKKPPLPKALPPPPKGAKIQTEGTQEQGKGEGGQSKTISRPPLPPGPPPISQQQGTQQNTSASNKFPLPPGPPPTQQQGSMLPPPAPPGPPGGRLGGPLPPPTGLPPAFLNQQQQAQQIQQQKAQQQQQQLQQQQQNSTQQGQNAQKKETVSTITGASTVHKKTPEELLQQHKTLTNMVPAAVRMRKDPNKLNAKVGGAQNSNRVSKPQQGYGLVPSSLLVNTNTSTQNKPQQNMAPFWSKQFPSNVQQGAQQSKANNQDMDSSYNEFMASLSSIGAFDNEKQNKQQYNQMEVGE